jgi:hypothetical protein
MHGIRRRHGRYRVSLAEHEREALRGFCRELAELLAGSTEDDPAVERLFPSAYRDDDEAAAEWAELARPGLEDGKLAALRLTEATVAATELDEEQAQTWLRTLNDLRLVLGTRLDVHEDDSLLRLREPHYAAYAWLTWLQGELVEALASGL